MLAQIYKETVKTQKTVDTISSTVSKLYGQQVKDSKDRKRADQDNKRKSGDKSTLQEIKNILSKDNKDKKKKEKKPLFDGLFKFLDIFKIGGPLLAGLGAFAKIFAIGGFLLKGLASFAGIFKIGGPLLKGLSSFASIFKIGGPLLKGLTAIAGIFTAPVLALLGGGLALKGMEEFAKWAGGIGKDGIKEKTSISDDLEFGDGSVFGARIDADKEVGGFRRDRNSIDNDYQRSGGGNESTAAADLSTPKERDRMREVYSQLLRDLKTEQDKEISRFKKTNTKTVRKGGKMVTVPDYEEGDITKIEDKYEVKRKQLQKRYVETFGSLGNEQIQSRQKGGAIRVPGTGSGDKVPAMLPTGSFVLNREASKVLGRQEGGSVPVMLEPGELVFPQTTPQLKAFNSAVPRFQQGGATGDAKPPKATDASKITAGPSSGPKMKIDEIKPGGKLSFIGDGSGFMGTLKLIDGAGKDVGSWLASSGVARTAKASQEERKNVSGTLNPLPDGSYPLLPVESHVGQKVGDWSSYINNGTGSIGNRSQLLVHNDIGSNGTAGCIGVELGGTRGSKQSKQFKQVMEAAAPTSVNVKLTEDGGPAPGSPVVNSIVSGAEDVVNGLLDGIGVLGSMGDLGKQLGFLKMLGIDFTGIATNIAKSFGIGPSPASDSIIGPRSDSVPESSSDSASSNKPYDIAKSMGFEKKDWDIYRNTVGNIESGNVYDISGGSGDHYDGRWQLGAAAKKDAAAHLGEKDPGHGIISRRKFQKDADMQERYFAAFTAKNHSYLTGLPEYDSLSTKKKFEVLGYAHNQGAGGAAAWLTSGEVRRDGFGTSATKYSKALAAAYGKQTGGVVGYNKGGQVPAMLEPGELVFPTSSPQLEALNSSIPRFQTGGSTNISSSGSATMDKLGAASGMSMGQTSIIVINGGGSQQPSPPPQLPQSQGVAPPSLPNGPSMAGLSDIINRVSWSNVF